MLELAGGDPAIEQDVALTVGAVLELGEEEVGHDPADEGGAAPDVAALAGQIPPGWVEHLGREVDHGDLGHVVGGAADAGAQRAETDRRRLGDDGVRDGSHGSGEDEGDDYP